MTKKTKRIILRLVIIVVIIGGILGFAAWYKLFRDVPLHYETAEEQFKYGSIGQENQGGLPYWIWVVMPRMFPEKLPGPGGYSSLGFAWEEGREMPIGFTKKTIGFERVGINCAFCHTATYRTSPQQEKPNIVIAAPSHQLDSQSYLRFLYACASDPRFNADDIMKEIDRVYKLPWLDRQLYRYVLIPQTKSALLKQKAEYAWMDTRPPWGRGRIDPFNPEKYGPLKQPMDNTIGNSDMPALWNQKIRGGMALHWDGLQTSLDEVFINSALGDGSSKKTFPTDDMKRLQAWITELQPPKFPFAINQELASRGAEIYTKSCASCHAVGQPRTGQVIDIGEVGTDRHRLDEWTQGSVNAYNSGADGYTFNTSHFRKTNGYASPPLDGIWLRAPYLHNGSVPTLSDLLEAPDKRPALFWSGYDVYDQERVGFISSGADAERLGWRYDTSVQGNSNAGHLWGIDLSPDEKKALVEFLKTQ
jgi:mono/diheme cytochrome c family protein